MVNPEAIRFFKYLRTILSQTQENVCFCFFGYTKDVIIDDSTGNLLYFADDLISCVRIKDFIDAYMVPNAQLLMIFDCNHLKDEMDLQSRSIFINDNDLPKKALILSAELDPDERAYEKDIKTLGFFSFSFWKAVKDNMNNNDITIREIEDIVNNDIGRFGLHFVKHYSDENMNNITLKQLFNNQN